jgi:hypothetical protein
MAYMDVAAMLRQTVAAADVSAPGNGLLCAAAELLTAAEACTSFPAHLLGPLSCL